jgi:hypothetical protein
VHLQPSVLSDAISWLAGRPNNPGLWVEALGAIFVMAIDF